MRALVVVGAIGAVGFSVVATPVEPEKKTSVEAQGEFVQCNIGYIEDQIVSIDQEAKTITFGDKEDQEAQIIVKFG